MPALGLGGTLLAARRKSTFVFPPNPCPDCNTPRIYDTARDVEQVWRRLVVPV